MPFATHAAELLTTRQAADLVGRSPEALKTALRCGRVPGTHVDGFWRMRAEDVLAWDARARRLPSQRSRPYDQVAEMLAEYGSVTTGELAELLMVHPGNARKHLAILANQGRAHRHHDGEWFPGQSCPGCLQEAS